MTTSVKTASRHSRTNSITVMPATVSAVPMKSSRPTSSAPCTTCVSCRLRVMRSLLVHPAKRSRDHRWTRWNTSRRMSAMTRCPKKRPKYNCPYSRRLRSPKTARATNAARLTTAMLPVRMISSTVTPAYRGMNSCVPVSRISEIRPLARWAQ